MVLLTEHSALAEQGQPAITLLAWHRLPGGLKRYGSPAEACAHVQLLLGMEPSQQITARSATDQAFTSALLASLNTGVAAADPALPLDEIRLELLEALTPPPHWPRDHALSQVLAGQQLLAIGNLDLGWLRQLDEEQRRRLVSDLAEHCQAHEEARVHQQAHLPSRQSWLQKQVAQRLRDDFGAEGYCQVTLDLPAQLEQRALPHSGDPRQVPVFETVPSVERELISLEQFLLHNIDPSVDSELDRRLDFLAVQVESDVATTAARLRTGIDSQWLKATATALDLAQAYESVLTGYFFPAIEHNHQRRALLRRPFETALALQARLAGLLGLIDTQAQAMLELAVQAHSPDQWGTVRLQPVGLTVFDQDLYVSGAQIESALLIVDTARPCVLLYLPQAPEAILSQHATVAEALEHLAGLCLKPAIRDYIASRAIEGDPKWLAARIDQALQNGFYRLFQSQTTWPGERSMAQQLLNERAGAYLRTHRQTARSNGDLLGLHNQLSRQQVVDGIQIALGFLPGVGTLIGIGEGLYGLYKGARHFERGTSHDGLLEVQMALMALLGAALDLLPTGAALSPAANRAVARASRPGHITSASQQRLAAQRLRLDRPFEGYAVEHNLEGLAVGTENRFKGVYQDQGNHWILRNGQAYQVQWDTAMHTWRLRRPGRAFAEQPVALGPEGTWETHRQSVRPADTAWWPRWRKRAAACSRCGPRPRSALVETLFATTGAVADRNSPTASEPVDRAGCADLRGRHPYHAQSSQW
ncbi:dermonecrotic toxin domain-containing protein [Pseudomonas sp. KNUC1026]|uniref:dermonecrotic toxin domain-containing protein n=1 Tax=Pseudomonas sp. KNUC1026 TaxID=2893890 RepID=UPI001F47455F|nr:DUF6543 domain-containing protein [Pseudomonas sp. KNUC1026]UFH50269.1 hypothetical protein LN139_02900 [Pseudomonas sp. KNUC1026]